MFITQKIVSKVTFKICPGCKSNWLDGQLYWSTGKIGCPHDLAGLLCNELNHPKLIVRSDDDTKPLKEKIDSIADWVHSMGAKKMMYLSIDLPLLEKEDIIEMIDSHKDGLTLVEAKKDVGTNALISGLPRRINFQFGTDSFQKHIEAAKSEKLSINIQSIERLSFDLDDHDDWELLIKYYQPEKNPLEISN